MSKRVGRGGAWRSGKTAGAAVTVGAVVATAVAVARGTTTVAIVGGVAYLSMAVAAAIGGRAVTRRALVLVWGYGVASGAMVTSAAVFLLPQATAQHPVFGGMGVALGVVAGYTGHVLGHRLSHIDVPVDRTVAALTAHAIAAGTVIGVIYGSIEPGLVLGVAIVSHKAPAGYAAATRYAGRGGAWQAVLVPAGALGIAAVAASAVPVPTAAPFRGVVFGFATGVFLHVATDFLPQCEIGSEIHEATDGDHARLDRLRLHAVVATLGGTASVLVAWLLV